MKLPRTVRWIALAGIAVVVVAGTPLAQDDGNAEKVAALKQSLQAGMAAIRKYEWVETTTVSMKGEEKSKKQNRCFYGADGKVQKVALDSGQADSGKSKKPRGVRGKVVEKKKDEISDYMADAVALVKQYVPPNPEKIQAAKDAGKMSVSPLSANKMQLQFRDYAKEGDALSVFLDPTTNRLLGLNVDSYLKKPGDTVTLDVTMTTLDDGALYASQIVLDGQSKNIKVDIENGGHRPAQ